jgi:hypothetical protein
MRPQIQRNPSIQTRPAMQTQPGATAPGQNIDVQKIKAFTELQSVTQGFRLSVAFGENPFPLVLNQPGFMIHGIAILAPTLASIAEMYLTFKVNSYSLIETVNALQLCPNYSLGGGFFYPSPYLLTGNDKISININKLDAGTVTIGVSVIYLPSA